MWYNRGRTDRKERKKEGERKEREMTIEFIAGITAMLTGFLSILGIVTKVGRAIASLEEAVKQLKQFMESQAKKNSGFLRQIVEQERRIALLESCVFSSSQGGKA